MRNAPEVSVLILRNFSFETFPQTYSIPKTLETATKGKRDIGSTSIWVPKSPIKKMGANKKTAKELIFFPIFRLKSPITKNGSKI